jgi:hypothetical protein
MGRWSDEPILVSASFPFIAKSMHFHVKAQSNVVYFCKNDAKPAQKPE